MLNLGTAAAKITLDVSDIAKGARLANSSFDSITAAGSKVDKSLKGLDGMKIGIDANGAITELKSLDNAATKTKVSLNDLQPLGVGLTGIGAAVGGALGIATKGAIDFDGAMGNVNSIAQLSTSQLSTLSDQVLKISTATGQGPETLADGLYDIESSGFAATDALTILNAAANAANAGLTDTGTSAAVITAVLNSYSLAADQAGHVSDVLFQTVNDGVVTFGQLSQYMGQTLPIASSLGVPIEQLGAAYALMTKNGLPVAETQTDINALLSSALNPTDALTAAVQAHGYASAEDAIKTGGLSGFLDILSDSAGGSETELTNLLGTQNASAAAMILQKNNGQDYTDELGKMNAASKGLGATQTALNKQQDTTAFKLKKLGAAFDVAKIKLGEKLEPAINLVANGLTNLLGKFSNLPAGVLTAVAGIGAVTAGVAGLGGGLILALPKIQEFGGAAKQALSIVPKLSPPLLIAAAAVAGIGLAYKTNFLGFADGVHKAAEVGEYFGKSWKGAYDAFSKHGDNPVAAALKATGVALHQVIPYFPMFQRQLTALSTGFLKVGQVTQKLGKYFSAALGGNAEKLLKTLPGPLQGVAHGIGTVLDSVHDLNQAWKTGGLTGLMKQVPHEIGDLGTAFRRGMTGVGDLFRDAAKYAGPFGDALKSVGKQFDDVGRIGQDMAKGVSSLMKGDFSTAMKWGKEAVSDFGKLAKDSFDTVVNTAKGLGSVAKSVGSAVASGLGDAAGFIGGIAKSIDLGSIGASISGFAVGLASGAMDLASTVKKWITDTALPALKGFVQDVGKVASAIAGFAVSLAAGAVDLASAVKKWITDTGLPALKGFVKDVGQIALTISKWFVSAGTSIYESVKKVVDGAISAIAGIPWGKIENILITIGSWFVSAGVSIYDDVKKVVDATISTIAGIPWGKIDNAIVSITGWSVQAYAAILPEVKKVAQSAWSVISGQNMADLDNAIVTFTSWSVKGVETLGSYIYTAISGDGGNIGTEIADGLKAAIGTPSFDLGVLLADAVWDIAGLGLDIGGAISAGEEYLIKSAVTAVTNMSWGDIYDGIATVLSNPIKSLAIAGAIAGIIILALNPELIIPLLLTYAIGSLATGFISELAKKIGDTKAWGVITNAVAAGWNSITHPDWSSMEDGLSDVLGDISDKFAGWYNALAPYLSWLIPGMPGHIETRSERGQSIGKQAIQGVADPSQNQGNGILNQAQAIARALTKNPAGTANGRTPDSMLPANGPYTTDLPDNAAAPPDWIKTINQGNVARDKSLQDIVLQMKADDAAKQSVPPFINPPGTKAPTVSPSVPVLGPQYVPNAASLADALARGVSKSLSTGAGSIIQAAIKKATPTPINPTPSSLPPAASPTPTPTATPPAGFVQPGQLANVQALAKGLSDVGMIGSRTSDQLADLATHGIGSVSTQAAGATAASGLTQSALDVLGQTKATPKISQTGAEDVTQSAGVTQGALEAIPVSWATALSQSGAEAVTGAAGITRGALQSIPTSWFTGITQQGAETVRDKAYDAAAALFSIPDSRFSTVGADVGGTQAVLDLANAINAVHSVTVYVNALTNSGLSNFPGLATGGYVTEPVTWLAEQGPELIKRPDGSYGYASTKNLYSVPQGSFVYTADQTANMLKSPQGVGAYAKGTRSITGEFNPDAVKMFSYKLGSFGGQIINGWEEMTDGYWHNVATDAILKGVRTEDGSYANPGFASAKAPTASAPTSAPTRAASTPPAVNYYYVTNYALKQDDYADMIEGARAGGDLARNLGPALTQIRQTASTPTIGRR